MSGWVDGWMDEWVTGEWMEETRVRWVGVFQNVLKAGYWFP